MSIKKATNNKWVVTAMLWAMAGITSAAVPTANDFLSSPPVLADGASPLVMLALSNDHELFKKAYSDYTDLDGINGLDTTYNDAFDYYGYFNSNKCYSYTSSLIFEPTSDVDSGSHQCNTEVYTWSGNFLNWASMTRMDVVRKMLYGGKRSLDTSGAIINTILERALIPNDIHAFVKTVSNTTLAPATVANFTPFSKSEISLCNTTLYTGSGSDQSGLLNTATNPPLIRVAEGIFPQWSTSNIRQCAFGNGASSPAATAALGTGGTGGATIVEGSYVARVAVCVSNDATASYCRSYEDSGGTITKKPAGLLQKFGEEGDLRFGLITGSYNNNAEGGVLRKNITNFSDATATDSEVILDTGIFTSNTNSIVGTLDSIRISGWNFGSAKYTDCSTHSIDIATFKSSGVANRQCRDWGNPLSEIYLEALRYFSGTAAATSAFATDDSTVVGGVTQDTWSANGILDTDNACADCAIIVLSTGLNSFDADNLATAGELPGLSGTSDVVGWTEAVGDAEGNITGQNFIVGNADATTNSNKCTTKSLSTNGLGGVLGLCTEIPQLEGSFQIAGLAYYAHNTDLRPTLNGVQSVNTYTVALAESLPSFEVTASNGNTVSFVPSCQANTNGSAALGAANWNDCSLTDVTVVAQTSTYGHLLFGWEDSHWGNDYDMDGISSIEYCTATGTAAAVQAACGKYSNNGSDPDWGAATAGQVQMRASVPQADAGNALSFGFIMNGSVSNDGTAINVLRPGGSTIYRLNSQTTGTVLWDSVRTYTASASTGKLLENPLWYAAKYGNFNELDGDVIPVPNLATEWDVKDINGNLSPDGIPDSFFPISNPANLESALEGVFNDIGTRLVSSAAAAVVANSSSGTGAVYQGVYYPKYEASVSDSVNWVGMLHAIFVDEKNYLREDTNQDGVLGDYNTDYRMEIYYDSSIEETRVRRYQEASGVFTAITPDIGIQDFKPIWNARNRLSEVTDVITQRSYTSSAAAGRYIFTGIDSDKDGRVVSSEVIPFDDQTFPADISNNNFRYLGLDSTSFGSAPNIVNFIRGEEGITGYRSRAVNFMGDSAEEIWRLGDLIHSEPASVSAPNANYDSRYGDDSYTAFRQHYVNRRQVVYVGANDGMLHAFNAGFYNQATTSFNTQPASGSVSNHPLGSELWAYVPMNLLSHLRWLTSPDYQHVYYVDGSPRVYDAKIFSDDADHPGGWGTILVMGMRFGGGEISLDPDSDLDADTSDDITTRSAYIVMDITNPEVAPTLIAEISYMPAGVSSASLVSSGSGYTSPPSVTIAGDGSGATASATLETVGSVNTINVGDAGSGFTSAPTVTISGDGSGAAATAVLSSTGGLESVSIVSAGKKYDVGDALVFGGNGSGAMAQVSAITGNGSNSGQISAVTIINAGSGYSTITVDSIGNESGGAAGTGAALTASLSYGIDYIQVDSVGSGYSTISASVAGGTTPAVLSSVLSYGVASIEVDFGGANYTTATVSISGNGSGAAATISTFADTGFGYTTSKPVVIKKRVPDSSGSYASNSATNEWLLVMGSGPMGANALSGAESDANALLAVYDLIDEEFVIGANMSLANSYIGDLAAVDWDNDYIDDAIYFGLVAGTAASPDGEINRFAIDFDNPVNSDLLTLLNTNSSVVSSPRLEKDDLGNQWVYAGTGRLLVGADNSSTASQAFYGIKESDPVAAVTISDMIDVTDIQVFTDNPSEYDTLNYVRDCTLPCSSGGSDVTINSVPVSSWQELRAEILKTNGWYRELNLSANNTAAARSVGPTNLVSSTLVFVEYAPSLDQCQPVGYSRLNAVHYQTGTASPYAVSGVLNTTYNPAGTVTNLAATDLGTAQTLTNLGGDGQGDQDNSDGSADTGNSEGELTHNEIKPDPSPFGRQSWQELNINWDIGL